MKASCAEKPLILVVDDDVSVCRALARLLRAAGFEARTYQTPSELLAAPIPRENACLVLDVNLPEMDGVTLAQTLSASGHRLPVIMITGRTDLEAECLMGSGHTSAVLFKPFDEALLLNAIRQAMFGPAIEV